MKTLFECPHVAISEARGKRPVKLTIKVGVSARFASVDELARVVHEHGELAVCECLKARCALWSLKPAEGISGTKAAE